MEQHICSFFTERYCQETDPVTRRARCTPFLVVFTPLLVQSWEADGEKLGPARPPMGSSIIIWGFPESSSIFIGIFHEINHPAIGVPPFLEALIFWKTTPYSSTVHASRRSRGNMSRLLDILRTTPHHRAPNSEKDILIGMLVTGETLDGLQTFNFFLLGGTVYRK